MTDTTTLLRQVRALHQLTQAEIQTAEVRVGQARTDAVRRELEQNASNARQRHDALLDAIRDLGGVPDVVSPVLGRLGVLVKSTVEQGAPLDEALLQDLALEHQLLDRARYLKVLAQGGQNAKIGKLAERLITAHTATVEWLSVVLAEEGLGGSAALQATALQRIAGGTTRLLNMPARFAAGSLNRAFDRTQQTGGQARGKLSAAGEKASQLSEAARDVVTAGRNASLRRAETLADVDGDRDTAESVHAARREAGALSESELPINDYDQLNVQNAIKALKALNDVQDVHAVLRYEETHSRRSSVVSAAQTQVADLAKQALGVS